MSTSTKNSPPVDPAVVALIRWFTNYLEMVALERYMGKRTNAGEIKTIFKETFKKLQNLQGNDHCDPPWEICGDDKCEPACWMAAAKDWQAPS